MQAHPRTVDSVQQQLHAPVLERTPHEDWHKLEAQHRPDERRAESSSGGVWSATDQRSSQRRTGVELAQAEPIDATHQTASASQSAQA